VKEERLQDVMGKAVDATEVKSVQAYAARPPLWVNLDCICPICKAFGLRHEGMWEVED